MSWTDDILGYWFDELSPDDWFGSGDRMDEPIRERFQELWEEQKTKVAEDFLGSPEQALAAIILFDQFPRNMFRDTAEAFATDHLALQIAKEAIDREMDHKLTDEQRMFVYMPFMHSEDLDDQTRSLGLFTALGIENNIKFAKAHRDIIVKYGRFPHRNEVLGRETRPEEQAAIEQGSDW
ncbi:DUF924 family protein [Parasphingorhabdus cellanae]|uniref:DUF924 domain-containing protein n=1 Tax=Parasphingorhabdus cellanae TaxID=2806553 RepID=A0ABX7T7X2_9SPHN|nr:DUF924 family protein [Parasphingorhabdus cellanae]QTD56960.1 DUF924 domain-containing protein [Parasphingorhabdus cellanae]